MIVDLSIDLDFFVRELPIWDWGHSEVESQRSLFTYMAWSWRYQQTDLYGEMDLEKYADFHPRAVLTALASRGLDLSEISTVGYADSHALAAPFFTRRKIIADKIISLDAHPDVYGPPKAKLNCGNWVHHVRRASPKTEVQWIWPRWKTGWITSEVPKGGLAIPMRPWGKLRMRPVKVRDVMICRSGAWVPPHIDGAFKEMLEELGSVAKHVRPLEVFYERSAPSMEDAAAQRAAHEAQMAIVMARVNRPAPLRDADLPTTLELAEEPVHGSV